MVADDPVERLRCLSGRTLNVSNWDFLPFAFMNIINPIYAIIITYMGVGIKYKEYDGLTGAELREAKAKKKAELKAARAAARAGK